MMGIRSYIRSIMPPTQRHFDASLLQLHQSLKNGVDELSAVRKTLDESLQNQAMLLERLSQSEDRFRELSESVRYLRSSHEYVNLEYLSLSSREPENRILLAGWYGASNCGDELMMRSVLKSFNGKNVRVSVLLWNDPYYVPDNLPEYVDLVHYPQSRWHLDQLADYYDALVWGGGAILDDTQYTSDPYNYNTGNLFILLTEAMLNRGKKVYSLGLSSNISLSDREYLKKLQRIIFDSSCFSLRDENSFRTLERANLDVSRVMWFSPIKT